MAASVEEIQISTFNWKALDDALKTLARAIGSNRPVEGAGIRLTSHGDQGVEIARADAPQSSNTGNSQDGGGGPVIWNGVDWKEVTLIDPVTCEQTQVQILVKSAGGQIQIG